MKIYLAVIIFTILSCSSNREIKAKTDLSKNIEPGKCYYSEFVDQDSTNGASYEKPFIIELVEPTFYEKEIYYSDDELLAYKISETEYRIPSKEPSLKLIFRHGGITDFSYSENAQGFAFCLIEVAGEIAIWTKEELEKRKNIVPLTKVKEDAKVYRYESSNKENLQDKSKFYFKEGYYTLLKESNKEGCHLGIGLLIKRVKSRLIELGYNLELNNDFDRKTKEAVLEFQKQNNLIPGSLDLETLKLLGIEN